MISDEEYTKKVNTLWYSEIALERLKEQKKIKRKQVNQIENKLRKLSYEVWLNSPRIKNDPIKQKEIALKCVQDFVNHNNLN